MNRGTVKNIILTALLAALVAVAASCGGGGGGGGGGGTTSTQTTYGGVQGYVYAPVGSGAREAESVPAGYKAVSGALVMANCGGTEKNGSTNDVGYYNITALPAGSCSLSITKATYNTQLTSVTVIANKTTTVGGASGISLVPTSSGAIRVVANTSGGQIIIDKTATNVAIPSTLSYTFSSISPGNHTVSIQQAGFDSVADKTVVVSKGQTTAVEFVMNPVGNRAPVANAGKDKKAFVGTRYIDERWTGTELVYTAIQISAVLDATGSTDPDSNRLTYSWGQEGGPTVALSSYNSATASFVPEQEATYTFSLKVSDGYLTSASDTIVVYAYHPTGKLVFSTLPTNNTYDLFTINADGSSKVQITYNPIDETNPAWSPDCKKIVYGCQPTPGKANICTINSSGTGYAQLTSDEYNYTPHYSTDGTKIVWAKLSSSLAGDIYKMNADGTNVQKLTTINGTVVDPRYSPDGSKILFLQDFGGDNYEVMVMGADGSNVKRLTNNSTTEFDAVWMPDGKILYTSAPDLVTKTQHLYVMNADGTGRTEIPLPYSFGATAFQEPIVSSDGRFFYFISGVEPWIMNADGSTSMGFGLGIRNIDYCQ